MRFAAMSYGGAVPRGPNRRPDQQGLEKPLQFKPAHKRTSPVQLPTEAVTGEL